MEVLIFFNEGQIVAKYGSLKNVHYTVQQILKVEMLFANRSIFSFGITPQVTNPKQFFLITSGFFDICARSW